MTVLERAAQEVADAAARPPFLFQLPIGEGRALFHQIQSGDVGKPHADVSDIYVDAGPLGRVPVRVLRPSKTASLLPVILYLHAGWAFGDTTTHDRLVRELAAGAHAAVVFPSFSLSPEAKYPTAINEIYAVAQWIWAEGTSHGGFGTSTCLTSHNAWTNQLRPCARRQRNWPACLRRRS
jgi:acetyl esterase